MLIEYENLAIIKAFFIIVYLEANDVSRHYSNNAKTC